MSIHASYCTYASGPASGLLVLVLVLHLVYLWSSGTHSQLLSISPISLVTLPPASLCSGMAFAPSDSVLPVLLILFPIHFHYIFHCSLPPRTCAE